MARKIQDKDIEKILTNFEDSDLSDLGDSQETETVNDLFDAIEENEDFVIEELSRQGSYEINISKIDDEQCGDLVETTDTEINSTSKIHTPKVVMKKMDDFRWKKTDWTNPNSTFSETYPNEKFKVPVEYFLEYFQENFLDQVVDTTNQATLLKDGKSINFSKEELLKFLALEITIGSLSYPRLEMYWTKSTAIPCFAENMSRIRFHTIRNNIKFTEVVSNSDKLYKIRPLLDAFTKKFYQIPKEEHICVDEMMIPFKGRTTLRQYMPKKPIKWGIKVFCLCGSKGMIYDFEIYQGKGTVSVGPNMGFCSDIVMHLTKTVPENKNYKIFFDNYFSSLNLLLRLKEKGIWATGTIRGNRISKVPLKSEKELKKEGRGSFDYRIERGDNLFVTKWLDGGTVQLVSSIYGDEPIKKVARFCTAKKEKTEICQPNIVAEYNKHMGGVDKMDFLLSLYRISIRSKKWTLKVFDHFIDMAICNSWLEYRRYLENVDKSPKKHMDLLEFRNDVAAGLIALSNNNSCSRKRGRPRGTLGEECLESPKSSKRETAPSLSTRYDGNQHWPEHVQEKGRCKMDGCSGFTRYKCLKCSVHLCIPNGVRNCFKNYHYRN